jgi:hypothetical protein
MAIRLSTPSKMRGTCRTWSLQAIETCPASKDSAGNLVPACANCYADKGFYNMPSVKEPRAENKLDWKRADWVSDMVDKIGPATHFRWFDSGDMYSLQLAEKMLQVMKACKHTKFWLPTRMHKFSKFAPVIAKMQKLENVAVRKSSDSINGATIRGKNTSTIITTDSQAPGAYVCPATKPGNTPNCKANSCTACWDKSIAVIAYNFH